MKAQRLGTAKVLDMNKAPLLWQALSVFVDMISLSSLPDDLKLALESLADLDDKHRLFAQTSVATEAFRLDLVKRILTILQSHERDFLLDELVNVLFRVASFDFHWFFSSMNLNGATLSKDVKSEPEFAKVVMTLVA